MVVSDLLLSLACTGVGDSNGELVIMVFKHLRAHERARCGLLIAFRRRAHIIHSYQPSSPLLVDLTATTLPTDSYNLISILLPAASITPSLVGTLESALLAGGSLEVRGLHVSEAGTVESDLKLGGLTQVQLVDGIVSKLQVRID